MRPASGAGHPVVVEVVAFGVGEFAEDHEPERQVAGDRLREFECPRVDVEPEFLEDLLGGFGLLRPQISRFLAS